MDVKAIEWIIGLPLLLGMLAIAWYATTESHKRLDDPNDDRTVYLDGLREILRLAPMGTYRVTILRQSGNVHLEKIVNGTAHDALATALSTFRRAKIDAVHVGVNTERELRIGRLYHEHRGSNEGKKVGKAHIVLIRQAGSPVVEARAEARLAEELTLSENVADPDDPQPLVSIGSVGLTCDCGQRFELSIDELEQQRACMGCGADATLTAEQIAQIEGIAEQARSEALTRYQAGETNPEAGYRGKLLDTAPGLSPDNIHHEAAHEAVGRLGYLSSEAIPALVKHLRAGMAEHPRTLATAYRKAGEQLTKEEKKAAGIRANVFMSRQAYCELTDKGRENAITAHELTLLRAYFTVLRYHKVSRSLPDHLAKHFVGMRYSVIGAPCTYCKSMSDKIVSVADADVLPSPKCNCITANYSLEQHFDWLTDLD